jgi:hypothetical protein
VGPQQIKIFGDKVGFSDYYPTSFPVHYHISSAST